MIINIKYNINENIKYIDKNPRMFFKACHCCNGLGYIIGADNIKYNCPFCKGEKETFYKIEMEEIKKVGTDPWEGEKDV